MTEILADGNPTSADAGTLSPSRIGLVYITHGTAAGRFRSGIPALRLERQPFFVEGGNNMSFTSIPD